MEMRSQQSLIGELENYVTEIKAATVVPYWSSDDQLEVLCTGITATEIKELGWEFRYHTDDYLIARHPVN